MSKKPINKTFLLKAVCVSVLMATLAYFSFQNQMAQKRSEMELELNASPPQRDFGYKPYPTPSSSFKRQDDASLRKNNAHDFDAHLDDYLSDPEDELTYPPEIFDARIDDNEEDIIENEIDY
ncbi:hypothetical protein C3V43_00480 [Bacteroides heparinolyticus]|uniref:hypothetical protein n=1 Tax=Prevotella heparinolytica TaxID=28113 RepID=UPI000D048253|nr:hypothetical protein [Bacteroides heparinolyticus]AVM56421.1 hypothetical protein C3V43_00480 [Bacteroides heparinolyticus]